MGVPELDGSRRSEGRQARYWYVYGFVSEAGARSRSIAQEIPVNVFLFFFGFFFASGGWVKERWRTGEKRPVILEGGIAILASPHSRGDSASKYGPSKNDAFPAWKSPGER